MGTTGNNNIGKTLRRTIRFSFIVWNRFHFGLEIMISVFFFFFCSLLRDRSLFCSLIIVQPYTAPGRHNNNNITPITITYNRPKTTTTTGISLRIATYRERDVWLFCGRSLSRKDRKSIGRYCIILYRFYVFFFFFQS